MKSLTLVYIIILKKKSKRNKNLKLIFCEIWESAGRRRGGKRTKRERKNRRGRRRSWALYLLTFYQLSGTFCFGLFSPIDLGFYAISSPPEIICLSFNQMCYSLWVWWWWGDKTMRPNTRNKNKRQRPSDSSSQILRYFFFFLPLLSPIESKHLLLCRKIYEANDITEEDRLDDTQGATLSTPTVSAP